MAATGDPVNTAATVIALLHTTWSAMILTDGVGFTVIENTRDVPAQLFDKGVTVIIAVTGTFVRLVATKELMVPEPLAARPIAVVLLAQL